MKKNILILGCGVSGLTCGIRLLEKGFEVRIVAQNLPPNTTSNVAAAYWYPYKVSPKDKVLRWAGFSFKKFLELSKISSTDVSMIELVKLFDHKVESPFWREAVSSFSRGSMDDLTLDYKDAYIAEIPLIETPVYMRYLLERFENMGGSIEKLDRKISLINELCSHSGIIINCSGLGARELCNDEEVYPIRGQIVRTTNPGITRILSDEIGPLGLSYVVPRTNDCILGGTVEEHDWNMEVNPDTAKEIIQKCSKLEPKLRDAEVLEHRVGLRPGRSEVCIETEQISPKCVVIHNYGHGGAGFTLSWGCAEEVFEKIRDRH